MTLYTIRAVSDRELLVTAVCLGTPEQPVTHLSCTEPRLRYPISDVKKGVGHLGIKNAASRGIYGGRVFLCTIGNPGMAMSPTWRSGFQACNYPSNFGATGRESTDHARRSTAPHAYQTGSRCISGQLPKACRPPKESSKQSRSEVHVKFPSIHRSGPGQSRPPKSKLFSQQRRWNILAMQTDRHALSGCDCVLVDA